MQKLWNKKIAPILIWASVWGIIEATVGYVLHLLPINVGWVIWYPIAYYFMYQVYRHTGNRVSILYTAVICAGIKMLDLFLPVRIDKVINPAVSILFESVAVYAGYYFVNKFSVLKKHSFLFAFGMNTVWRVLYILYIFFMPQWMVQISPIRGISPFFHFLLLQNIITSFVIYICIKYKLNCIIPKFHEKYQLKIPLAVSVTLLLSLNIFLQLVL